MFFILFLFVHSHSFLSEVSEGLWSLDSSTIDEALAAQPGLLIEFFSPSCSHCADLAPEYAAAARALNRNKNLKIAAVDGTKNEDLLEKYEITAFPTLLYALDGLMIRFHGSKTEAGIVQWVTKMAQKKYIKLESNNDLEKSKEHKLSAIYIGDTSHKFRNTFDFAFQTIDDCVFHLWNDANVTQDFNSSTPVVVYIVNKKIYYYNLTESSSDFLKFLELHRPPKIYEWNIDTAKMIVDEKYEAILFCIDEEEVENYLPSIQKMSEKHHKKLLFTVLDLNSNNTFGIEAYFAFTENVQPTAIIIAYQDKLLKKYKTKDLTEAGIDTFIQDWSNNKAKPFYRTQLVPSQPYENRMRVLVGSNFKTVVNNKEKDVFVYFYDKKDTGSYELLQTIERLAYELKDWKDVEFCKIEVLGNEVEGVSLSQIPFMKFYPKNNKAGLDLDDYFGKFSILSLIERYSERPDL
jgi:protein disulfide-isomerase A1